VGGQRGNEVAAALGGGGGGGVGGSRGKKNLTGLGRAGTVGGRRRGGKVAAGGGGEGKAQAEKDDSHLATWCEDKARWVPLGIVCGKGSHDTVKSRALSG
jgi:hypothetical protein